MNESTERTPLRILLVLTGGTIGTVIGEDGMRRLPEVDGREPGDTGSEDAGRNCAASGGHRLNTEESESDDEGLRVRAAVSVSRSGEPMLLRALRERAPKLQLDVKVRVPYQVLSEHMTLGHLEKLAGCLREEDLTQYDGVFVTHGSDTLAYTAAFLGELMQACPIPVFLLATQRPLEDPGNNGVENTLAATELLREAAETAACRPAGSFVYIPYRNSDGVMYLHHAEELCQCRPGTDDFFSAGMTVLERTAGGYHWPAGWIEAKTAGGAATGIPEAVTHSPGCGSVTDPRDWRVPCISLTSDVLVLHPYVGIRYDCISLKGVGAVLHTLYHSSTAPKELADFLDRCREAGVSCYILPCDPEDYHYETTAELLAHGAIPLSGLTEERAYMRLLLREEL